MTNIPADIDDFASLVKLAKQHNVNFMLPGPDMQIVAGIVDYFKAHAPEIPSFGPSTIAARMEGSKTFSKDFMKKHNIPTAAYENFSDYDSAKRYLDTVTHQVVLKADGLAAGKGVLIPANKAEAFDALDTVMKDRAFGSAGDKLVIEEFMTGHEISILSFSDGKTLKSLAPAQDHKRIGEGDTGLNTGGMGTYAPTPLISENELVHIHQTILQPTIDGMRCDGMPFVGCLFTGLMMTESGAKVLEYNVRFGDPETQSCLPLMSSDLAEIMEACVEGRLDQCELKTSGESAATVVVVSKGYPESYPKGKPITLKSLPERVQLFHAGTTFDGQQYKTSGGRVIASTATGPTLKEAVDLAYQGVACIEYEGKEYRRDIAARALK